MTYLIVFRSGPLFQQEDSLAQLRKLPHCQYDQVPHDSEVNCNGGRESRIFDIWSASLLSDEYASKHQRWWLAVSKYIQK